MRLSVDFTFAAAHHLPRYVGKCARPHGHNYRMRVVVAGEPDAATGMLIDFHRVESVVGEMVLSRVDHTDLNDLLENPTAELLAQWIYWQVAALLPGLVEVSLWEMADYCVTYSPPASAEAE